MNCFFLWVPFFLIRFGLMSCLDKSAVRRWNMARKLKITENEKNTL